jgi:crotonobetainyl-CoA:carnitine CoA-transferase CaiB-like acyl-CoA transferase
MVAGELKVIDAALGFASAIVTKFLADNGAQVTRVLPVDGDPFGTLYPAYESLKAGSRIAVLPHMDALSSDTDVVIVGGESFPGVDLSIEVEQHRARNPRLIVVNMTAYVTGAAPGPAVDLLVQARTGLVNEQLTDQPIQFAMALPTYGAALSALLGLWAAIYERDRSGSGQIVHASMQQGLSLFWSQIWMRADNADATFDKLPPKNVTHLIFECVDGHYIHFVLGVPGALAKLYEVLKITTAVDPNERGVPNLARGPQSFFADRDALAPAIRTRKCDELVRALNEIGLAAERVRQPGEAWLDPQVEATGLLKRLPDGNVVFGNPCKFKTVAPAAPLKPSPQNADDSPPLAGLRVIDLGNFVAGPFASKLLADLGADVIKIEPPTSLAVLTGLRNTWSSNRGKRSIVIDLKQPQGLALAQRLCAAADVTTHNFRLGVAERLGVDPASLRALRKDIITLETSGYGSTGPKAKNAGWDMVMQALCGHEARAGGQGNPPLWYRSALIDFATGSLGAIAVLMAAHARDCGAGAVEIETSLLATGLFLMSELVQSPDGTKRGAPLLNAGKTGFHPAEQIYRTQDGWLAIAARSDTMASGLLRALDITATTKPRRDWDDAVAASISSAMSSLTTEQATARLSAAQVWFEPCTQDGWAAMQMAPYSRETNLLIDAQDPVYGHIVSTFGPPLRLSRSTPQAPFLSAPQPGEHTRAVLTELNLPASEIDQLFAQAIVR